jgi:hypothetical protein
MLHNVTIQQETTSSVLLWFARPCGRPPKRQSQLFNETSARPHRLIANGRKAREAATHFDVRSRQQGAAIGLNSDLNAALELDYEAWRVLLRSLCGRATICDCAAVDPSRNAIVSSGRNRMPGSTTLKRARSPACVYRKHHPY